MNSIKTVKIGVDGSYKRPVKTVQDKLTKEDIEEKLENYKEVDDINNVPLGTHVRYYTIIYDKQKGDHKTVFRLGGVLTYINNQKQFVKISNGKYWWSVQIPNTVFYKKMTLEELKEEYEKFLDEKDEEIKKLKSYIKKVKTVLKEKNININ
jgi:hypothetical protein